MDGIRCSWRKHNRMKTSNTVRKRSGRELRIAKRVARFAISFGIIGAIIWKFGGLGDIGALISGINPLIAVGVILVSTLDRAAMTFKWKLLLSGRGVRLPFIHGMKIYCASMIWGMFLPSTIGSDAIRVVSTSRAGLDASEVTASIVIERMVGFLSAMFLGLLALVLLYVLGAFDSRFVLIWWAAIAMMLGGMLMFAASFSQRAFDLIHGRLLYAFRERLIFKRLRELHTRYRGYKANKRILVIFFLLTFLEQLIPIFQSWLNARGLGIDVGILFVAGAVPLALLISRLPISINGIGVFDGAYAFLLSFAGVSPAEVITMVLISRMLQIISWAPWWAAHVLAGGKYRVPNQVVALKTSA